MCYVFSYLVLSVCETIISPTLQVCVSLYAAVTTTGQTDKVKHSSFRVCRKDNTTRSKSASPERKTCDMYSSGCSRILHKCLVWILLRALDISTD